MRSGQWCGRCVWQEAAAPARRESRTIHAELGPKMVTNWQGGGGGKAAKSVEYGRRYPVRTEEPVRREGATGPERPKRMRPDGAVCYVEPQYNQ